MLSDITASIIFEESTQLFNCPNNTWIRNVFAKSVSKGTYLVTGSVDFSSNYSGIRVLIVSDDYDDVANDEHNSVLGTGRATLSMTRVFHFTSNGTIYLNVYQGSTDTTLQARGYLQVVKLN